ncbi:dihydropteroate synthase [Rhizobium rhizosphaerae]|uniref:Dihydropteroate synthase n=1 Tax=Xaviernesmea rhizosphaerae TaxID=1672749 RepID=A0ABX3PJE8_9HYPH|nr:dihydropteroate synthase [Xaviernesmea rhizosphaerae]OQP88291.1 dihydropteroate synthase [Xaviernesmea rhizosphaerae]
MTIDPFAPRDWALAHGRSMTLGPKALIMAIVNVTPDSFSDGGAHLDPGAAVAHGKACLAAGAEILDIGGESTRPGAAPVSAEEEQARILPVIAALAAETDAILSIDTYRAETARLAIAAGAHLINDVHGLWREPDVADVAAEAGAGLCLMHTGRDRTRHEDVIEDQSLFFAHSLDVARRAGVAEAAIVLDPGFGFAKETAEINLALMDRLPELFSLGFPLLVGTSRKRFLGTLTGREAAARDVATAATSALMRMAGAAIFRVHAVEANRDALLVADALLATRHGAPKS